MKQNCTCKTSSKIDFLYNCSFVGHSTICTTHLRDLKNIFAIRRKGYTAETITTAFLTTLNLAFLSLLVESRSKWCSCKSREMSTFSVEL